MAKRPVKTAKKIVKGMYQTNKCPTCGMPMTPSQMAKMK